MIFVKYPNNILYQNITPEKVGNIASGYKVVNIVFFRHTAQQPKNDEQFLIKTNKQCENSAVF